MAHLIDLTQSMLSTNTICFDSTNLDSEKIPVPIENAKFGIINFNAITSKETTDELDFLFMLDCSGSMSDMCSDRRSKMHHIIHTLKNMIMFFHERPNIKINITIKAFDTLIYKIVTRTKITEENIGEIMSKIDKILPKGSTNVELALRDVADEISEIKRLYPNNIISHIFMTDGEVSDGSKDINILKNIVCPEVTNAFIGFGIDHDSTLLNGISSIGKSGYYFIDKLENAGLVYGEILHEIIYKILINVEINIENGLIYDFKTNKWVQSLKIADIVSECNKTFNIISSNPDECKAYIKGTMDNLIIMFPSKLDEDYHDLTSHIYRQRTLQILYEVNDFCNRKREIENRDDDFPHIFRKNRNRISAEINKFNEEEIKLKHKLIEFIEEIKKYMSDNELNEDKILKNLCDDIYICYRTFGTKFGSMFCTARRTSQGTQRQYTASNTVDVNEELAFNIPDIRNRSLTPHLIRQTNMDPLNDIDTDDLPSLNTILSHEVSDYADTPYLTPQATQVMREISTRTLDFLDNSSSKTQLY